MPPPIPMPPLEFQVQFHFRFQANKKGFKHYLIYETPEHFAHYWDVKRQQSRLEHEQAAFLHTRNQIKKNLQDGKVFDADIPEYMFEFGTEGQGAKGRGRDPVARCRLHRYLLTILNHKIETRNDGTTGVLGEVLYLSIEESERKSGTHWFLDHDDHISHSSSDLTHSQERIPFSVSLQVGNPKEDYSEKVALTSPLFPADDPSSYIPQFENLHTILQPHISFSNFPRPSRTYIRMHIPSHDSEHELAILKALIALYGIFEDEILSFLPLGCRVETRGCKSLRRGMEKDRDQCSDGKKKGKGGRYTPEEFVEIIEACEGIYALGSEILGTESGAGDGGMEEEAANCVSIDPELPTMHADHSTTMVEFRHLQGTFHAETIYHWVSLLSHVVKYAFNLSRQNITVSDLLHDGVLSREKSILELIALPKESRIFWEKEKERVKDELWDKYKKLQDKIIEKRRWRKKKGEVGGREMDERILGEEWFGREWVGFCRERAERGWLEGVRLEFDFNLTGEEGGCGSVWEEWNEVGDRIIDVDELVEGARGCGFRMEMREREGVVGSLLDLMVWRVIREEEGKEEEGEPEKIVDEAFEGKGDKEIVSCSW